MQKLDNRRHVIIRAALAVIVSILFAGGVALTGSNEFSNAAELHFQQQSASVQQDVLVGTWDGTIDAGSVKIRLVLKVFKEANGTLKATLDSPDQGATDLPTDSITLKDHSVLLKMTTPEATYDGQLSGDGSEIAGQWNQSGQSFPLTLKRNAPAVTVNPADPKLEKVDAGGHRLNLLIAGQGSPAVILEGGFGAGIASWTNIENEIAKFTRVVSYDRAGLGQSEPGPKPRTAKQFALELHTALKNAGINPPYVLVGHSMGGITIRVFADMYSQEVAGLVLVDPSQEGFNDWLKSHPSPELKQQEAEVAKAAAGIRDESAGVEASFEQARKSKLPPEIPVILLVAVQSPLKSDPKVTEKWIEEQREWVKKVPGAKLVRAEKSGHFIQGQQPELVIAAIKELVDKAKSKKP
jgi:pimeloyl-ACP methyl ester carboxylesterase